MSVPWADDMSWPWRRSVWNWHSAGSRDRRVNVAYRCKVSVETQSEWWPRARLRCKDIRPVNMSLRIIAWPRICLRGPFFQGYCIQIFLNHCHHSLLVVLVHPRMATLQLDPPLWPRNHNNASNASTILAASGLMTALSLLAVVLRVWVRQVKLKARGKDDILIMCAMVREMPRRRQSELLRY